MRRFWRGRAGAETAAASAWRSCTQSTRYGGHVALESREGEGTIAELVLPREAHG